MIDVEVAPSEGAGTLTLLRSLAARGLAGVDFVAPDDRVALVSAIEAVLPGCRWQRCRTSSSTCSPGSRSRCRCATRTALLARRRGRAYRPPGWRERSYGRSLNGCLQWQQVTERRNFSRSVPEG